MDTMTKAFLILVLLITATSAGCASTNGDNFIYKKARRNFIYKRETTSPEQHLIYTSVHSRFTGDCEDFAFTLQRQIGGIVWHVVLNKTKQHHAVLVKDGVAYGNKYSPMSLDLYPARFVFVMRPKNPTVINN